MKKMLILTLAATLATVACTKKREERFAQGEGTNLETLADYNNKTFELKTGDVIASTGKSAASEVKIDKNLESMNNFDLVSFKTDAKLLKEIPFRGRTNFTYTIKYEIDEKMLKIFKIADEKDIPFQERTYAEKEEGKLKVPLMGYKLVGLYRIEKQKNANGEDTNVLKEMKETDPKKATHFKVDLNEVTLFEAIEKIDVYPASLFDGDWYFAETIIGTTAGREADIGSMDAYDQTQRPATKIRFEKTNGILRGYNVNIDKRLNQNETLNHISALELPVTWVDFQVQRDNGKNGLAEEAVRTDKVDWNKRRYMVINFNGAKTIQNNADGSKVVDIEVSKNYIGFTILRQKAGVRIKYSFLRAADRGYTPKVSSREDRRKFGYFLTQEEFIRDYNVHRREDLDRRTFVNRFNPKNGKIVFHFTPSSPKAFRAVGVKAIEEWNKTFMKAAGIKVELDQSFDAQLGDLRYNSINIIESVDAGGGLLGFGPSITDPYTGEIISATANLHVTPIKSGIISNLRNYVRGGVGQLAPNELPDLVDFAPPEKDEPKQFKAIRMKNGQPTLVPMSLKALAIKPKHVEDFSLSIKNFVDQLNTHCASEVSELKNIYNSKQFDKEVPFLESCANKLMGTHILPTLLHELGHNFGLRHNFTASNDVSNFSPPSETGGIQVRTSSVMDYLSFNEDYMVTLGRYDEAAIRFGYADTPASQLGSFKFCTDEDVDLLSVDPMCARHDAGITATEVVSNYIRDYKALYSTMNFRYDRIATPDQDLLSLSKFQRYIIPMKRYYDQWRLELAQARGLGAEYLEDIDSPEEFEEVYKKVSTPRLDDLRTAANTSYLFLRNMLFLPNRYCVTKMENGRHNLIELERVRNEIYTLQKKSITSCSDNEVPAYLSQRGQTLEKEIGYSLNDMRNSLDPRDVTEPFDVVGAQRDRLFAAVALTMRAPLSSLHEARQMIPNYLDEPLFRLDYEQSLAQRVVGGLSIPGVTAEDEYLPRFQYERRLLVTAYNLLFEGLEVPMRPGVSGQRLQKYRTYATRVEAQIQNAVASVDVGGTFIAAMSPTNVAGKLLIETLEKLQTLDAPSVKKEAFKGLIDFTAKLPNKESLTAVTIKEFLDLIDELAPLFQKTPMVQQIQSLRAAMEPILKAKVLDELGGKSEQLKGEELEAFLKLNVLEYLKSKNLSYPFVKENFAGLEKEVDTLVLRGGAMQRFYMENKLDIDAQSDLIYGILQMTSQ